MKQSTPTEQDRFGRIAAPVSLAVFCMLLIVLALVCVSSAKGTLAPFLETESDPSDPPAVLPWEESSGSAGVSRDPTISLPGDASPDTSGGEISGGNPEVSTPVEEVQFRDLYADEHLIGEYRENGVQLRISKVERGELNLFICDFVLDSPSLLHTAFAGGRITGRQYTSKIAQSVNAVFAVNGDFCGYRNNGIIIREGALVRDKSAEWDLLYLDKNGDLQVGISDTFRGSNLISEGALQSWCFGPTLVKDHQKIEEMNRPGLSSRAKEPRTAIGQVDSLHYIILVADAIRTDSGTIGGMTFSELADEFVALGCKTAYNLDGGGSTTLYFRGEVINQPCVNGERSISDIIYLK